MKLEHANVSYQGTHSIFYVDDVDARKAESTPIAVVTTRHKGAGLYQSSVCPGYTKDSFNVFEIAPRPAYYFTNVKLGNRYNERTLLDTHKAAVKQFDKLAAEIVEGSAATPAAQALAA